MSIGHSGYQEPLHNPSKLMAAARWLQEAIAEHAPTAQAIAARGMSGALIGGVVSALSDLPLLIIRKTDDKHHGYHHVQGPDGFTGPYVIVDDFIESGETVKEILAAVYNAGGGACLGIFLYNESDKTAVFAWGDTLFPLYTHRI